MSGSSEERTFEASVERVGEIVEYVSGLAVVSEVHPKRIMQVELAVEEAAMNICSYAYEKPPGHVLVRVTKNEGRFIVELEDEGVPFDPLKMDEPDIKAEIEDRRVGGLGVFLLRRVMDEVHYSRENGCNRLTLVVYLQ
ncbi:MAG: ATP-binding protein [Chitinophagales bacterium]